MEGIAVIGRADMSGLASMTIDFCANMPVECAVIVNYESRGRTLASRVRANSVQVVQPDALNDGRLLDRTFSGIGVLVGFETFYSRHVLAAALRCGVRTVLFPMYECTPQWACEVDYLICCSEDDGRRYSIGHCFGWPVDRSLFAFQHRHVPPRVIQHNGGTFGLHGRNGTETVLSALGGMSGADLRMRSVEPCPWPAIGFHVSGPVDDRSDLFRDVDLLLHPQVIGGCSMPISEATASGIPVIVADIPTWSHFPHRVRVTGFTERLMAGQRVRYATLDGAHLRSMVEDMVSGRLEPVVGPQPPTWEEFRCFWAKTIRY